MLMSPMQDDDKWTREDRATQPLLLESWVSQFDPCGSFNIIPVAREYQENHPIITSLILMGECILIPLFCKLIIWQLKVKFNLNSCRKRKLNICHDLQKGIFKILRQENVCPTVKLFSDGLSCFLDCISDRTSDRITWKYYFFTSSNHQLFSKYSICWVFLALHHELYLCIC